MNQPATDELAKQLKKMTTVDALEKYRQELKNCPARSFPEYMNEWLNKKEMTQAQLIEKAQISRTYGYQLLNGTRNPGRDRVIALCLALSMPLDDVQRALTLAKEGILYPKNPRDSILIFCIENKKTVSDANFLLDCEGEKPL